MNGDLLRAVACAHGIDEPVLELCREDALDAHANRLGGGLDRAHEGAIKAADEMTDDHREALVRLADARERPMSVLCDQIQKSTPGMMAYWAREAKRAVERST